MSRAELPKGWTDGEGVNLELVTAP